MVPPPQTVTQPGGIIEQVAALARQYKMNVVAPIREKRGAEILNTAVVLNRSGAVIGRYSKMFPVFGPPDTLGKGSRETQVNPSEHGVVAVDMDFGRIALAICFDINFAEVFHQAAALDTDIMVWPSMMHTPDPFTYGYARIHQYHFVAVGNPGDVVDKDGTQHATTNVTDFPLMKLATLDIDRTFVHWDNNEAKMKQLMAAHNATLQLDLIGPPFWLLRSLDKGADGSTSARALIRKYNIETARDYAVRSRQGLNVLRQHGAAVPGAL